MKVVRWQLYKDGVLARDGFYNVPPYVTVERAKEHIHNSLAKTIREWTDAGHHVSLSVRED